MITFNEEKHEYKFKGAIVPSVNEIISDVIGINKDFYTAFHATRGKYVHRATAWLELGKLNKKTLDPELGPYVLAYENFFNTEKPEWFMVEEIVFHKDLFYAGTLDRYGIWNKRPTVLDIKTGAMQCWHALQLAGYAMTIDRTKADFEKSETQLIGLYLKNDGSYKIKDYTDPALFSTWESAVRIYHWKRVK